MKKLMKYRIISHAISKIRYKKIKLLYYNHQKLFEDLAKVD